MDHEFNEGGVEVEVRSLHLESRKVLLVDVFMTKTKLEGAFNATSFDRDVESVGVCCAPNLSGRRSTSEFTAHLVDVDLDPVVVCSTDSHKYVLFKNMY